MYVGIYTRKFTLSGKDAANLEKIAQEPLKVTLRIWRAVTGSFACAVFLGIIANAKHESEGKGFN